MRPSTEVEALATSTGKPVTFGSVLVLFLIVAAVASVIPAVRAGRTDPLKVLRAE